jgi:hypothetical protein
MPSAKVAIKKSVRSQGRKVATKKKATSVKPPRKLTASYFHKKAARVKGPEKFVVMLEMNKYISQCVQSGVSFKELEKQGYKFATV